MNGTIRTFFVSLLVCMVGLGAGACGGDDGTSQSESRDSQDGDRGAPHDSGTIQFDASDPSDASAAPDVSDLSDAQNPEDSGPADAGAEFDAAPDTGDDDAGLPDGSGTGDAGQTDSGSADAAHADGGTDASHADGGTDGGHGDGGGHPDGGPNPQPPGSPVKLIFIHHSTGENWLGDDHGHLATTLRDNNYFVSDTNYGWGPDAIGDTTDIGHWHLWFRGGNASTYTNAVYAESSQHSSYSRLASDPGGANEIVMFKSCFPNSALKGVPNDPVPAIGGNPLKGQDAYSAAHTVANAKGIYIDILEYFKTHQEKLFVVITAPPLQDPTHSSNARAFNQWLVNDWLAAYTHDNVAVFDFFNVLTTNGGNSSTNDLGQETGNHHRWWKGAVQHKTDGDNDGNGNVLEYDSSGDDHPSPAGGQKASAEFVKLLNIAWHRWSGQ